MPELKKPVADVRDGVLYGPGGDTLEGTLEGDTRTMVFENNSGEVPE